MKNSSHIRKEIKKIQTRNEVLVSLKKSSGDLSSDTQKADLKSLEPVNLKAKAVRDYYQRLATSSSLLQDSREKTISYTQSRGVSLRKKKPTLDNDITSGSVAIIFDSFDCHSPNYLGDKNQKDNKQSIISDKEGINFKEFTGYEVISYLLFASNNNPKTLLLDQVPPDMSLERIAQNSVKFFLLVQDSYVYKCFPIVDPSNNGFDSRLVALADSPIKNYLKDSPLLYAAPIAATSLVQEKVKENPLLNSNMLAREISQVTGEIESIYLCLKILLSDLAKPHRIIFLISHHLVKLNNKINELEALAYRLMTSVSKSFDKHFEEFMNAFSKIYLLFHANIAQNLPKLLMESSSHKYFINEALKLKFQQNQINLLLGKMFYNLKKVLTGYFKVTIDKEIKKDSFNTKTDLVDKNKLVREYRDFETAVSHKKSQHNKQFLSIFKILAEILAKASFTEKWRSNLLSNEINVSKAFQNMEFLTKINVLGSFLESMPVLFASKKFQLNFTGIMIFHLSFLEIVKSIFEKNENEAHKKNDCLLGIPEFNNYKVFILILIFLTSKDKSDRVAFLTNLGNADPKNDAAWIKKIRSKNFNKPEGVTMDMVLRLLTNFSGGL